jgi:hypothetical protein
MAAATTASPEQRPTTARIIVRVLTTTNIIISIINQPFKVLFPQSCRHNSSSAPRPPPRSTQMPRLRHARTPTLGATDNSYLLISEF